MKIGDKTFLNLQEAVAWLLENNALPYQSTANYVGNTEIALSTLINPSPAKVRVGSIIFFADSKVSTVIGLTSNSFIVSDQYNDLMDDVVYVSNVAINASDHLIVTLSNGDNIDAGLIKQVSNFSIDASQHLIASYNDGTSTDLGAIFSGNINISGTLNATSITGDSIIETMTGYTFVKAGTLDSNGIVLNYVGIVKNGNKLTFVIAGVFTKTASVQANPDLGYFDIPVSVWNSLYSNSLGYLDNRKIAFNDTFRSGVDKYMTCYKSGASRIMCQFFGAQSDFVNDTAYSFRYECTFLLSPNLAS